MKCLLLHCDNFGYKTTEPTLVAVGNGEPKTETFKNTLLVLVTIEKGDGASEVQRAMKDFIEQQNKLATTSIVINPFAHLSSHIAKPSEATLVLKMFKDEFIKNYPEQKVVITSFGWNKAFHMDIAGHTHAHMYRHFGNTPKHTVE